jgi:hypothetical protein
MLLALAAACPLHAQSVQDARAFTVRLYADYAHGEPDNLGRRADAIFAPPLLALIRKDQAATPEGEVGTLDWDPICDCQDSDGLAVGEVVVQAAGPLRSRAMVMLRFPGDASVVRLDLAAARGAWRIADIHTRRMPSLVAFLRKNARGTSEASR